MEKDYKDFYETMSALYKKDPEAFDIAARVYIEVLIDDAPNHMKLKLQVMQRKIDNRLKKAGDKNRLYVMQEMLRDGFTNDFIPAVKALKEAIDDPGK